MQEVASKSSPQEILKRLIIKTQNHDANTRRASTRVLDHVIKLAYSRGYHHAKEFINSYREKLQDGPSADTSRLTHKLFEYVSADEFVQITRLFEYEPA